MTAALPSGRTEEVGLEWLAILELEALAAERWHQGLYVEAREAKAEAVAARAHVLHLLDEGGTDEQDL